jgi:hypothetical protein
MDQEIQNNTENHSKKTASEILTNSVKGESSFFLNWSKPFIDSIDNGAFFKEPASWLYSLNGIAFLLIPLVIAFQAFDNDFFDYQEKYILVGFLFWIILTLICLVCFQIWINRKNKLLNLDGSRGFVATKIMADIISTSGECYGVIVGVLGFFTVLFSLFTEINLMRELDFLPFGAGVMGIIAFPVAGYFIIIATKFLSEFISAIATIARNTAK